MENKEVYTRSKYKNSKIVHVRFALQNPFDKDYKCSAVGCRKKARGMRSCLPFCAEHYNNYVKREDKKNEIL